MTLNYANKQIFNSFNLIIPNSNIIGLLGSIGSGKSTLLKTLAGLTEYTGDILIDGQNLNNCTYESIVRNIAYIPQHPKLFNNTIYYNVGSVIAITGGSVNANTWYHIAVVRNSGSTRLYVNGTQSGSTYADSNSYVIGSPFIGTGYASSNPLNGYITNLRVFNGASIYTTTFTPSTTPLSNTAGGSTLAITAPITSNGYYATAHAQLTTQYLSVPGTPFVFGTNPFTVECWVYLSSFAVNQVIIDNYVTGPSGAFTLGQWQFWCNTSGAITFTYATAAGVAIGITTTTFVALNTWTHIAAVRSSTATNGFAIYINGVSGITGTISATVGTNTISSIGIQTFNKSFPTVGMISNVRITKSAVYTGAFNFALLVQTGPLGATQSSPGNNIEAITGTSVSLLTCQSSTIVDNSTFAVTITNFGTVPTVIAYGLFSNNTGVSLLTAQNNNVVISLPTTAGSVPIAQFQVAFNGTNQYLTAPASSAFAFGTGDFTVEAWVYLTSTNGSRLVTTRLTGGGAGGTWSFSLSHTSMGFTEVIVGEPGPTATFSSILNTWAHVAAVRNAGVTTLYLNGTQVAQASQTTNFNNTSYSLYICSSPSENFIGGSVSNLRIVKGTAVYTAGFPRPTSVVTAITNTVLLICSSATFIDLSPNAVTITPVNSPVISVGTLALTQSGTGAQAISTIIADNSVNGLVLTNNGPAATTQLYGLFGTSITGLLALHTILTSGDSSFSTSGIVLTQTGTAFLERSFSPLSANYAPSLLTNQSVANNDTSISSAIITNATLNSTVAYQVTVNPFGITAPTALLTAQSNVLLSDTTGFNANYIIENLGGNMVLDTNFGPFNNDTPLLTLQNAIVIDNSNNRGRMTIVGGGVSPTDSSPFSNKSLTSLLIPYGYNDVSISNTYSTTGQLANSYVANNANTAITNTVFNPYVIPSTVVSVLGLQTSNVLLESSVYNSTFTTTGTAPTSNTSSPFGTYNGNGTLILNTSYTTGISGGTLNYANLVITSPDTTVTNTYSITVSANSTTNIGNRINIETGYNINLSNANITIVDVANSNISEATILTFANTSITPAVNRIDYGFSIAPSNATFIITDVANSNLSESLNSIFVSNVSTTKNIFDTGVITIRPSNINFVITDVANSNLAETIANVFVSNVRTTRNLSDTGVFPVPSPVGGTVLFPTYAYTDGVPISAANVQSGGGGSSTSSNQQVWFQT
jgi:ABC-type Fe3+/spermidine/putrescine transport system ATPase subunit